MTVFDFDTIADYATFRIERLPNSGRGEIIKIANYLSLSSSMISLVLKREKNLSLEHTLKLSKYFNLKELESEYLLCLSQVESAGTHDLKDFFLSKKEKLKRNSQNISKRIPAITKISTKDQALYYSNWYFSAIRLMVSIKGINSPSLIAKKLHLPLHLVQDVSNFLVSVGLLTEENGNLKKGPTSTHLSHTSPLIGRHHNNWRERAMDKSPRLTSDELMLSSPMTLSEKDFKAIRKILVDSIEEGLKIVDKSEPEHLYCLNLDWFKVES